MKIYSVSTCALQVIEMKIKIKSFYRLIAAVIRKQHFVSNHCQMIRQVVVRRRRRRWRVVRVLLMRFQMVMVLSSAVHTHVSAISVIMCQIKRCKDSKGRMWNRMPEIIRAYDVQAVVRIAMKRENVVTVNRTSIT